MLCHVTSDLHKFFKMATSNSENSEETLEYFPLDDDFDSIMDSLENDIEFNEEIDNAAELVSFL